MRKHLRNLGFLEAGSFLVLLFIAMPVKYLAGRPELVRVVGSIHGALFVLFVYAAVIVARQERWPSQRLLLAFVASTLPFGPFLLDRKLFPPESA